MIQQMSLLLLCLLISLLSDILEQEIPEVSERGEIMYLPILWRCQDISMEYKVAI